MPTALITGASSGLGEEFAYQLAREHYDLALVARRKDRLESVAAKAREFGAKNVAIFAADLSAPGAVAQLHADVSGAGMDVSYLVNNAGFGTHGSFCELPIEREIEEIELNVTALVALCRMFAPAMVARKSGVIINVASTAAFQPVPWMATYGATKAFVLSFSEALSSEFKESGVTVLALCPGPTRTEFQAVANTAEAAFPDFAYMDAATVVAQGIASAKQGRAVRINGLMNFVMAQTTRLAPRAMVRRIAGAMFREEPS
ncbi:MAG TPA: SDR family oxidoreductase [Candidatus Binataceae bacterium]|nr:SDR family oxidoreductase [Candidatus Binataceae bacterium]